MTTSQRLNPYVGPRSFRTGETLYGRDRELNELLDLFIAERIVLLYAPSGAGKSSLVQAALVPRLSEEGFRVLPVMRVSQEPPSNVANTAGFNRYVFSLLLSLDEALPAGEQLPLNELAGLTLAAYLDRHPAKGDEPKCDVLIFDQFEEILTVNPVDQDAKVEFFVQVGQALRDRTRWALFAMREDYIAGLDRYLRVIPTRLNNRFHLDMLEEAAARSAMQQPAQQAGVDFTEGAARRLANDLRSVRVQRADGTAEEQLGLYVEPVQLQVVCYRLWDRLPADAQQITEADVVAVGNVDSALSDYYAERVVGAAQATGVSERAIRDWMGQRLITTQGIRGQVLQGPDQGLDSRAAQKLLDAYLVRAEKRRGATWLELAHDRLIAPVQANNAEWREAHLSTLQHQADLWEKQNRPGGLLLRGATLAEAEAWARAHSTDMTSSEQDFLSACRNLRKSRRQRSIAVGAIISLLLILVVLLSYDPIRREVLRRQAMESDMVYIQGGEYTLGDQRKVEKRPYYYLVYQKYSIAAFSIDSYVVTNRRYAFCLQAGICSRPNALKATYEGNDNADKPVVNIIATDAAEFCRWLGQALPSDKEWELAARESKIIRPTPDPTHTADDSFVEWTRSPYELDKPEWIDVSTDPPLYLVQKGGSFEDPDKKIPTRRIDADSMFPGLTAGFRCVIHH